MSGETTSTSWSSNSMVGVTSRRVWKSPLRLGFCSIEGLLED